VPEFLTLSFCERVNPVTRQLFKKRKVEKKERKVADKERRKK
jgi:hypothetical protein